MLGSRTKQVNSYGKRSQRIVSVSDERESAKGPDDAAVWAPAGYKNGRKAENFWPKASPIAQRKTQDVKIRIARKRDTKQKVPSPKLISGAAKSSPKTRKSTTPRTPLASKLPINASDSNSPYITSIHPLLRANRKKSTLSITGTPVHPTNVVMDIIVLGEGGEQLSTERRVSRTFKPGSALDPNAISDSEEEMVPVRRKSTRAGVFKSTAILSDSDSDEVVIPVRRKPVRIGRSTKVTMVLSDNESETSPQVICKAVATSRSPAPTQQPSSESSLSLDVLPQRLIPIQTPLSPEISFLKRVSIPPTYHRVSSPVVHTRLSTPIRMQSTLLASPSSPSLEELERELDNFSLDQSFPEEIGSVQIDHIPEHLKPLLGECRQEQCGPYEFSSFIGTFPFDPVVQVANRDSLKFRKIGEASYSEVFGIGDVVLKVIPLRDETSVSSEVVDGPFPSDVKDVLKEVIVTRAMGSVGSGFVDLLKTYIVRGKYPELLLDLWDDFNCEYGSESTRPDTFTLSQVYAIIVLPNCGPDLESYNFIHKTAIGWKQACSIFWQVAKSLGKAEQLVSFEHRDLHWGQILIKNVHSTMSPLQSQNVNGALSSTRPAKLCMDDAAHGVRVTLIDLGLARMDAGDGQGGEMIHWTPFDNEIFEGQGDYQFDIYRMMRDVVHNKWEDFNPITNVMWLHYLLVKLLKHKLLKAPRKTKGKMSDAKDCEHYNCLVDIETWLRRSLAATLGGKGKKIKKIAQDIGPACAGEVVAYGVKKGWILDG